MAKVLYVEDNDDNVFMLTSRLKKNGLDVVVARDGEAGVATAVSERPDVIIMDLNLPVLDGWEATRRIKGTEQTKDIPVIGLSAHAMVGDREKALAAGCNDYDVTPVNLSSLLAKIRRLLPSRGPNLP